MITVSLTIPLGNGRHRRKIYAVLKKNVDKQAVEHAILSDGYFEHDECSVEFVESVKPFLNTAHRVRIERLFENQKAVFEMEIDNPSVTGRILAAVMRASFLQKPGAYFMPEIPLCDFRGTDCLEYL